MDLNGENRHLVAHVRDHHPFSVTIYEEYIYLSYLTAKQVERMNRFTGHDHSIIFNSTVSVPTMRVNHPSRQPSGQYL